MRATEFRVRLWCLMAIVAGVAILFAAESHRRRALREELLDRRVFLFRRNAVDHGHDALRAELGYRLALDRAEALKRRATAEELEMIRAEAAHHQGRMNYHLQMKAKYESAVRSPWLPVPPDPPPPK